MCGKKDLYPGYKLVTYLGAYVLAIILFVNAGSAPINPLK